jgi:hypothetical protein
VMERLRSTWVALLVLLLKAVFCGLFCAGFIDIDVDDARMRLIWSCVHDNIDQ